MDCRPISPCNTIYKIAAKILVNKLQPLLPTLIYAEQGAFMAGQNISGNILTAQKIIHSLMHATRRKVLMLMKVDMQMAYDQLYWSFIIKVLKYLGFHHKFIDRVLLCVANFKYAILIDGSLTDWILPSKGLHQGYPLSPYLFYALTFSPNFLNLQCSSSCLKCLLRLEMVQIFLAFFMPMTCFWLLELQFEMAFILKLSLHHL